ncbi:hypothetical protein CALVIDRAFT_335743 [Calocera viscosa TUFC12733]|uniref:P-loop containing nucleoside triphosphate hydrolase protein n=1 Tax=Calocera viscosa (strain TUFC12733) TaxID=1330018 RepID=A0A167HN22_CALVF|nr:hypothetical protein CALVIDRAFT_335743 [Calocera viscosa TUFC12733]
MDGRPPFSLPSALASSEGEERTSMHMHRPTSDRELRPRPPNRYSTLPKKRKMAAINSKPPSKRIKEAQEAKRSKRDVNKANTVGRNGKRVSSEEPHNRWMWKHRTRFAALLPPRSVFQENLWHTISETHSEEALMERDIAEQPRLVRAGKMRDYQLTGLSFLVTMYQNRVNAILGDEMGMGKTLQTLSLFAYIKEEDTVRDPHLVICPRSDIISWISEAARWVPSLRVHRFHGTPPECGDPKELIARGHQFGLLITTYNEYKAAHKWFWSRRWNCCVLDEGHIPMSAESGLADGLQQLGAAFRLILTGKPVHKDLIELWALLHWLYPNIFTQASESVFRGAFDRRLGRYGDRHLKDAQKLLDIIMIRRTKDVVGLSIPPTEELIVFVPFTEVQRDWTWELLTRMSTDELRSVFSASFQDDIEVNAGHVTTAQYQSLMKLLIQLRQCCDHPYLIPGAQPDPYDLGEHVVTASSKLIVIDKLLKDLISKGERVLIFTEWASMLDLLEDLMVLRKYRYAKLEGVILQPRRALDVRLFQQETSPYDVFLATTRAGGLGINLTKATHVVMVDCDSNPQTDAQAIARSHRLGQMKTVKVYRLICRGSVEDQMLDRICRKLWLSLRIMNNPGCSSEDDAASMKLDELLSILRNGSSILGAKNSAMDFDNFVSAPIDEILRWSRRKQDLREAQIREDIDDEAMAAMFKADAKKEKERLLSGVANVESRLVEGRPPMPKTIEPLSEQGPSGDKRKMRSRLAKVNGSLPLVGRQSRPQFASKKVKQDPKFQHEDWCLFCQDGGHLFMCQWCPRVFHSPCYGMSDSEAEQTLMIQCPQHKCMVCERKTPQAGCTLFRCATCANTFCEDCLPEGELDAIGGSIPQFTALGYGYTPLAYYIRCDECQTSPVIKYDEYENKYWEDDVVKIEDRDDDDDDDDDDASEVDAPPMKRAKIEPNTVKVEATEISYFMEDEPKYVAKDQLDDTASSFSLYSKSESPQFESLGEGPSEPGLVPQASSSYSMDRRTTRLEYEVHKGQKKDGVIPWLTGKLSPTHLPLNRGSTR